MKGVGWWLVLGWNGVVTGIGVWGGVVAGVGGWGGVTGVGCLECVGVGWAVELRVSFFFKFNWNRNYKIEFNHLKN